MVMCDQLTNCGFQLTAARRRLVGDYNANGIRTWSFNSQPPEGGWDSMLPPDNSFMVSTHSRPKAAGRCICRLPCRRKVSTHSRPKAAG